MSVLPPIFTQPIKDQPVNIGVLAVQGGYDLHAAAILDVGARPILVRRPDQLSQVEGLIIPGGESTTILKFLERDSFFEALHTYTASHPTFGTCAGCILLAKKVLHPAQASLARIDATVERNAYGRQNDSSIQQADTQLPGGSLEMVYIRAPRITRTGPEVTILATRDDAPVLIRQGHILAATFHPELSADRRVHQYFLDMVRTAVPASS